ncbi:MAG: hypothetical protein ACD_79C00560G0002 [uncultured bacterium]|nr:MAG: hypothetical protein ACD_79C00560G0002 [uncultured bacterium]
MNLNFNVLYRRGEILQLPQKELIRYSVFFTGGKLNEILFNNFIDTFYHVRS